MIQTWVAHHLEIIGEASGGMSESYRAEHPVVLWRSMIGIRNALVHGYFLIDAARVWTTEKTDLPEVEKTIRQILE